MKFQIGKNGVTDGVVESLRLAFKNNKSVRISVLKGAVKGREVVKEMADDLATKLGANFVYKIIGFTIIMRRTVKTVRSKI